MDSDTWYCVLEFCENFVYLSSVSVMFKRIIKIRKEYLEKICKPITYKDFGYEIVMTQKIKNNVGWCVNCNSYFKKKYIGEKMLDSRIWIDKYCIIDILNPKTLEITVKTNATKWYIVAYKKRITVPECWNNLYFSKQTFI